MTIDEPASAPQETTRRSWPKRLWRALLLLGVAGLVAVTLLVLSARWFWAGEIAASGRWFFGWAGLGGALLLCLSRSWRLALVATILGGWHVWPELSLSFGGPDEPGDHGTEITVATVNLLWGNPNHAGFTDWLQRTRPDIVCIQEVSPAWREIVEGLRAEYPHQFLSPPDDWWNEGTWGTAFLSRFPFVHQELHHLPDTGTRPVMEVAVEVDDRRVTLRGGHPTRPGRGWRTERRDAVLRLLADHEWDGAGILLGDLNVSSGSPMLSEVLATSGLRDSRCGFGRQASWDAGGFLIHVQRRLGIENVRNLSIWVAIDHILVGEDWIVLDRRTDLLPGSDHRPAIAVLALRKD